MLPAVHGDLEAFRVVVAVVVRDERKIQHRRKLLGAPVVEVDRKKRLRSLHHKPHVVHVPDRRMVNVSHRGLLHLAQHVRERRL